MCWQGEMEEMKTTMKTINANKCSVCQGPLDPPVGAWRPSPRSFFPLRSLTSSCVSAVHFLCLHSYHQHCLPESLDNRGFECVVCAKANQQLFETRQSLAASALAHDKFFKQLQGATDGFVPVADYLGRQIFAQLEPIMLSSDAPNLAKIEEEREIEERRQKRADPARVHEGTGTARARSVSILASVRGAHSRPLTGYRAAPANTRPSFVGATPPMVRQPESENGMTASLIHPVAGEALKQPPAGDDRRSYSLFSMVL